MLTLEQARARLAADPLPPNPWIHATDEAIIIEAGYTETMERMLRWIPRARWVSRRRCWVVPLTGLELVRSVLPELSRLAEAMQEQPSTPAALGRPGSGPVDTAEARALFRDCARLLYGSDWQRETARALGRDEASLACWVVGQGVEEAAPAQLLGEMLTLMRRRSEAIAGAADALQARLGQAG